VARLGHGGDHGGGGNRNVCHDGMNGSVTLEMNEGEQALVPTSEGCVVFSAAGHKQVSAPASQAKRFLYLRIVKPFNARLENPGIALSVSDGAPASASST
jgi:hypothetical protein